MQADWTKSGRTPHATKNLIKPYLPNLYIVVFITMAGWIKRALSIVSNSTLLYSNMLAKNERGKLEFYR